MADRTRKLEIEILADASGVKSEMDTAARSVGKFEKSIDDADKAGKGLGGGLDTLGDKADQTEGRFTGLASGIDGATTLMQDPSPQEFAQGLADMADGIANFAVPALKKLHGAIAGTVTEAAKATAAHAKQIATQIAGWVKLGIQSLLHAAKVAAAWLIAMGPIAIVGAAVVALVALIIANWDKVSAFLSAAWEKIKEIAAAAWEGIKEAVLIAVRAVVFWFQNFTLPGLILKHWNTIKRITSEAWNFVKTQVSNAVSAIVGFFTALPGRAFSALATIGSRIWDAFRAGFGFVAAQVTNAISAVVGFFSGIPQRVFDGLAEIGNKIWGAFRNGINFAKTEISGAINGVVQFFIDLPGRVGNALSAIANTIKSPFTTAFNAIKSLWNSTVGGFGFTVPGWVPGIGGKGFKIPEMASGGIVPGQFGSPQMILAHGGEMVLNPRQQAMLGGQPIVVNVYLDGDDVTNTIRTRLIRVGNRNGGRIFAA